jgi:predicted permease
MLSDLYIRLRSLFGKASVDQELDDELRFHLEQQAGKYQRAGLTPEQAKRKVKLEFGGLDLVKEECREARGVTLVETMLQDLRYGLRMLRHSPGFTAVVVLTLGLGIGANTAIFSIVNSVLLQTLPVRNPEQLVVLQWRAHSWPHAGTSSYGDCAHVQDHNGGNDTGCSLPYSMFEQVRGRHDLFTSATAFAGPAQLDLSGDGAARMAEGELVSQNYFQTLGVGAALGRLPQPDDERPGAPPVAVLDYGYWQRMFGGAANVVGRTIRLNNAVFTIAGVADPGFTRLTPGKSVDLWVPLIQAKTLGISWGGGSDANSWWLTVVGRLRPGVSRAQAQAAVNLLFVNEALRGAKPAWTKSDDPKLELLPADSGLVGIRDRFGKPLALLMAAVSIVLLIACANVAGLMLARGAARQNEMAVRLAMGAGRGRVVRQLLTESLLLSFLGAALGALLAYSGTKGLAAFFTQNEYSPLRIDLHPTLPVLLFTIGAAVLTGIGFGLAPAFRGARANVASELKGNSRTATAMRQGAGPRFGSGSALVVMQVALSVLVLTGAGLLLRTLVKLRSIDPGFDTRNLILFSIEPSLAGYKSAGIEALYKNLRQRLGSLPGVASVSYSSDALLDGGLWTESVRIEGQTDKNTVESQMLAVGPAFFTTMKIRLLAGRILGEADMATGRQAALVNQAFVRRFVGARNPLGLHFGGGDAKDPRWEIVGVVGDTKYASLRDADAPTGYVPLREGGATFAVRARGTGAGLTSAVRREVNKIDRNLPVIRMRTQSETIDRLLFNERLLARLFGLFGVLGLVLTCIGLYGLLSYEVARRTRELGIRTALGARRRDVLQLVLRQGLALVILGAAGGVGVAMAATRLLASLLYGVHPNDPLTVAAVAVLLMAVGAIACFLPARRATRVDPMVALRYE